MERRNFRTQYYDKVASRELISEKALINILKDDVIDRKNLENFCVRFSVPSSFRLLIWNILLDVLPIHQQSHKFVMQQRTEQFNDLNHALFVIKSANEETPVSEVFLKMYLLETGELGLQFQPDPWHQFFFTVSIVICEIVDSQVSAYWISKNMYQFFNSKNYLRFNPEFTSILVTTLKKENLSLFHHINTLHLIDNLPIAAWYKHTFSGVLSSDCLCRVWDILLGQAYRILPYIAVQILLTHEKHLFKLNSVSKCLSLLNTVPYSIEKSGVIVGNGIDMWVKHEKIR